MSTYLRGNAQMAFKKEDSYRTAISTLDAALATDFAFDTLRDEEHEIPEPKIEREDINIVGAGRNVGRTVDHDYPVSEGELKQYLQTAIMLAKALGTCVTTGTDTSVSGVTVVSVTNAVITVAAATCVTDAHIGQMVVVTSGDNSGSKYHIVDNDGSTITVDKTVPANLATDVIKIAGAPYTHAITEGNSPPSFAVHAEMENATDAQSVRADLLGCLVKKWTGRVEKAAGKQDTSYTCAKSVAGSDLAKPTDLAYEHLELRHLGGSYGSFALTYNSVTSAIAPTDVTSFDVTVENPELTVEHVAGDAYARTPNYGTRNYAIKIGYNPTNKTMYGLLKTALASFSTKIGLVAKIGAATNHYIQFTFSSIYPSEHGLMIPAKDKFYQTDIGFKNAGAYTSGDSVANAAGTLAVEAKDNLGIAYYEGST